MDEFPIPGDGGVEGEVNEQYTQPLKVTESGDTVFTRLNALGVYFIPSIVDPAFI